MKWQVEFHDDFMEEFLACDEDLQDNIIAKAKLLETFGPMLGRPHVDTLIGSSFANMKELRVEAHNAVWRIAFAFDPNRKAILLVGSNKKGKNQTRFYKELIRIASSRLEKYILNLKRKKS